KLVPGCELRIGNEFFEMITLSMGHKTTLVSDSLIDFQIKFSLSISGIVTYWFTLIVLSALRRSDNKNMLSLAILILRSILTDLQGSVGFNDIIDPWCKDQQVNANVLKGLVKLVDTMSGEDNISDYNLDGTVVGGVIVECVTLQEPNQIDKVDVVVFVDV
nr:hypothetical protein [Tanacetum cinerariifolium]